MYLQMLKMENIWIVKKKKSLTVVSSQIFYFFLRRIYERGISILFHIVRTLSNWSEVVSSSQGLLSVERT